jgi:hypothetical protein
VHLELPGYQVPLARSQKAPPHEMHVVVSRDEALAGWHVPRGQLTSGLTTGALAGGEVSVSHLSLEQEECKITIFLKNPKK